MRLESMCEGSKPSRAVIELSAVVLYFSASVCALMEPSLMSVRGCCAVDSGHHIQELNHNHGSCAL